MARVIAGMTTSLDGFVADEGGGVDRLYPDLAALQGTAYMNALIEETGAVVMGKRAFEMAENPDWYVGNYEFQVPIFVLTRQVPRVAPKQDEHLTFTFVADGVESAVAQAKAALGKKAVQVIGGASVDPAAVAGESGRRASPRCHAGAVARRPPTIRQEFGPNSA